MQPRLRCFERPFSKTKTHSKLSLERVSRGPSVAIRGERGSYNDDDGLYLHASSVAIRGERGSYNGLEQRGAGAASVAIRGERGSYNRLGAIQ